jgi:hypothetical protein
LDSLAHISFLTVVDSGDPESLALAVPKPDPGWYGFVSKLLPNRDRNVIDEQQQQFVALLMHALLALPPYEVDNVFYVSSPESCLLEEGEWQNMQPRAYLVLHSFVPCQIDMPQTQLKPGSTIYSVLPLHALADSSCVY